MVITLKLVVPFKPARRFCYRGLSLCLATNAAMSKAAASWLNSVHKTELFSPPGLVFSAAKWKLCLAFRFQSAIFVERNWVPSYYNHWSPHKVSPIRVDRLLKGVSAHRDQHLVEYLLAGIHNGFCFGFNPASVSLRSTQQNEPSASLHPLVIDIDLPPKWTRKGMDCWLILHPPVTQSSC